MNIATHRLLAVLGVACLAAAAESRETAAGSPAPAVPSTIALAVEQPARPAADRQRDAGRKPLETLLFAGVKPGDQVGELLPGGGYYTRLLSTAVGPSGHVYVLVPQRPANAGPDMPDPVARIQPVLAEPAYANVSPVVEPLSNISFPAPLDLVWTSQNYHDLHYIPGVDMLAFDRQVFAALKPGGIFLVLDHAAVPGSADRDAATLHRIDPETVKKEVLAAGFRLAASSDLLHNADDPHTAKVFDPLIRGKTDQFILKFQKPAATP